MRQLIQTYRRSLADQHHPVEEFQYVHMARKVVGVGSVGTRAWIPSWSAGTTRSVVPPGEGGTAVGPGAIRRPERALPTTASASWSASA